MADVVVMVATKKKLAYPKKVIPALSIVLRKRPRLGAKMIENVAKPHKCIKKKVKK